MRFLPYTRRRIERIIGDLRAERDYTAKIIEGTPSLVVGIRPDGITRFINPAVEVVTGYKRNELIGRNWWKIMYPGAEYAQVDRLFKDFEKGAVRDYEMTLTTKSKTKRIISWNSVNRFAQDGTLMEIIGFGNDMTDRIRAEEEVKQQQAILLSTSKLSAVGEMAAGIAHEINTPLATIAVTAGQLLNKIDEHELNMEFARTAAERIEDTTMRIGKIIKALKALSRDAEGEPFVAASVTSILEDTLALCRERFKQHNVDLKVPEVREDLYIECKPIQISQVCLNLLNNAYDAVENQETRWIRVDLEEKGDMVEISIVDSGCGIQEQDVDKIMTPFFSTKALGKGTGLGLSISRAIIENHRGQLFLDRRSPNTRFVICLPRRLQYS